MSRCPVCHGSESIYVAIVAAVPDDEKNTIIDVQWRWCFWCQPDRWTAARLRDTLRAMVRSRTPGRSPSTASREAGRSEQPARLLRSAESG